MCEKKKPQGLKEKNFFEQLSLREERTYYTGYFFNALLLILV